MSETIESRIEVVPCGCEESKQLRHTNITLQEQLQYLTGFAGKNVMTENELMLVKQNEALLQKNDHLTAVNKKLRLEAEILKVSHKLQADIMDNNFVYSSDSFEKDEPTEKIHISEGDDQTEDLRDLEDGYDVCSTVEVELAIPEMAMVTERLGVELEAKQALQAKYDHVKAKQQKFLLREVRYKQEIEELEDLYRKALEQNEKLRDEMENQELVKVWDTTFRSLGDSLEEAYQNEDDQMIVDVQKQQESKTFGCLKSLLVRFLVTAVTATFVFFAWLVSIFVDSKDPNALYDRHQYI